MKFTTVAARSITAGFVMGLFMAAQTAGACTLQNWSATVGLDETDASQGTIAPGGPNPATPGEVFSPRYSGLCAMKASEEGYVQDNSPGGINRIIARFYVLVDSSQFSGVAEVYAGFSANDGSGKLFSVTVDDAGNVTLTDTATGTSISEQGSTNWLSVEIDWIQDSGAGELNLIVNGTAATPETGLNNAGTALKSVQLGNLDGGGTGPLNFDAYESRRTTPVGQLLVSDANGDSNVDVGDITSIANEIFENPPQPAGGQPDCTEDGEVDVGDITCAANIVFP